MGRADKHIQCKNTTAHSDNVLPLPPLSQTQILTQSAAIMRYIGQLVGEEVGLYPGRDDLVKAAQIDAIMDQEVRRSCHLCIYVL